MPLFQYRARNAQGQLVDGEIETDTERTANAKLAGQGLIPLEIKLKKKKGEGGGIFARFQRVPLKSQAIFFRQFSTMINAGLSLVRSLDILTQQTEDKKLKTIATQVKQTVQDGATLEQALQQHPQTFNQLSVSLVRAGETGGVLDEVLERLATFLEKDQQLRSKVRSAMTYPAIVFVMAIGIVLFLVTFVLPTFISMFEGLDLQLPTPTKVLLVLSKIIRGYWYIVIIALIGAYIAFSRYLGTEMGKRQYDRFILKMPVFGQLNQKVAISRFSRTLGTLLNSGVPVLHAMEVVAQAAANTVVTSAVMKARASIREGESIADPLGQSGIFPPMVTQMIAVGEETGNLSGMLQKISDFYDLEVETTLSALTSLLEPLLMVGMGGIVGFIVISMFLPMFKLISGIK